MLEVKLSPQAIADFTRALRYYNEQNPAVAERFDESVAEAIEVIQRDPLVWAKFDRQHRRYSVRGFPYSVFYRTTRDTIEVVAIAHAKRRPNYWKE